jgi:hypothetical protein
MTTVVVINLLAIIAAMFVPNDTLVWHSYAFYAFQLLTLVPFLLGRTREAKDLFLPTTFVLAYFLMTLTFGAFLVPRNFGWSKLFTPEILDCQHYNIIVPFMMSANLILFLLSVRTLRDLARADTPEQRNRLRLELNNTEEGYALGKALVYFSLFFAISALNVFSALSFQLAILIMHLTEPSLRRRTYRFAVYGVYILGMLAFGFENKRELAVVLFLILFLEGFYSRAKFSLSPANLLMYGLGGAAFFVLVLAASILRGYGDFPVQSVFDALLYIPQYVGSEFFVDGITDNLELNYQYGTLITAMDHGIRGLIDFQYGTSLVKWLFLPIPREALPIKPESMMALFTARFVPDWWVEGGSLPVNFASDMFLNFHVVGLLPFTAVWWLINRLYFRLHCVAHRSVTFFSCIFLTIIVLFLARGSGLEQWLLYWMFALPLFVLLKIAGNLLRRQSPSGSPWVI